ncbi:hypothetical protein [Tardiphaga robiniae]|uniref:Uncharacterized protein n=1 Tax=Tardiphaga robiniae TaxID=943830 RepID=A0A7G6TVG5_9BRAD|nr:hypothetical protein [Tardiphaga robiniae]QND70747.1 hypothetical protein HB776_05485 [Tardiphaga robiniae]
MIYLYVVTGCRTLEDGATHVQSGFGTVMATSRDEALGKAIQIWHNDHPSHKMVCFNATARPDLRIVASKKARRPHLMRF